MIENFDCNFWQFIVFGVTCFCGGIRIGMIIEEFTKK